MLQELLIAVGSNLGSDAGDRAATASAALQRLARHGLRLRRVSRFFETPCFPAGAGPDYVNACAAVDGLADPDAAMEILHAIEADFGRSREQRWGSRTLDLDLLAAGDTVLPDAATQEAWRNLPPEDRKQRTPDLLILPHPRLQERGFVLVPLADIAADWRHPLQRRSVAQMLAALPQEDCAEIRPLDTRRAPEKPL